MSYRDDDDPFEEDIVFDQAGLLSTSRKSSKSAIRRNASGKCAMFSKTLGLYGAFLGLGLTFAIPGPLSPVPPTKLSQDFTLMTYEVMYRCQGFMIGAMFGSRLLDRFNRLFLVFLALLVTALLVTIIPWCGITSGIVWLLRTDMFLLGVSFGFLMTGGNVLCLDLWGRNSGPFMQALHFSFSLGLFLAPFLSQPLMAPVNNEYPVPTTTPTFLPLHRLPRDLGNISFFGTNALNTTASSTLHPSAELHPSVEPFVNKTWISTSPPLFNTVTSKAPMPTAVSILAASQNSSIDSASSHGALSASSSVVNSTAQSLIAVSVPSLNVSAISSTKAPNESVVSISPSLVPSTSSSNTSEASGGAKADVSTTTHRARRPKPVLTDAAKLKDQKWEDKKFGKPPPQDLIPVSTTMKPKAQSSNKTDSGNVTSASTPPSVAVGSTSSSNLTKAVNVTGILVNATAKQMPISSTFSSPLNVTSAPSVLNSTSPTHLPSGISISQSTPGEISESPQNQSTPSPMVVHPKGNLNTAASNHSLSSFDVSPYNQTSSAPVKISQSSSTTTLKLDAADKTKAEPADEDSDVSNHSMTGRMMADVVKSKYHGYNQKMESINVTSSHIEEARSNQDFSEASQSSSEPITVNNPHSLKKDISEDVEELSSQPLPTPEQPRKITVPSQYDQKHSSPFSTFSTQGVLEQKQLSAHIPTQDVRVNNAPDMSVEKVNSPVSGHPLPTANNSSLQLENSGFIEVPEAPKHTHHSKPDSTLVNDTEVTHTVIDAFANRLEKYGLSRMQLMYLTVGMVLLGTSFLFLGFLCFNPRDPKSKTDDEEVNGHIVRGGHRNRMTSSGQTAPIPSRCMRHTLIGLMMLLLMITSGVQAMYGQLLLVYAVQSPLQLPQSTGTALTATFWGALTSTRFACILLASALSPTAMLVLSVSICSCATWLLSAFASSSEVALWIGSVMVSVGTASVFPSGMLWMQRHVLITHRVASMLVMGPAMGEMFLPTLAYKMMVSLGPASLVHLPALLSLFAIALWAAVWRLARYPRQPLCSHIDESSGYQLANQHDEDDLLDLTMSPIVNGNGAISRSSVRSNSSNHRLHQIST